MNRALTISILAVVALAGPRPASAQDARLTERLDRRTSAAVAAVVDSAEAVGLPTEPLIQKALEGASKGADGPRIVAAVRGLARRLETAQDALGDGSNVAELVAGADALFVGTAPATLADLRAARPQRSVAVPLIVLADLVQRGAAADTVSGLILELTEAGIGDANLTALRRLVEQDIRNGAAPSAAIATRARGLLMDEPGWPPDRDG